MSTITRIYLPSSGAPSVSPGYNSLWDDTASADRVVASSTKHSTAMALKSVGVSGFGTGTRRFLVRQFIVNPALVGMTLTGVGTSTFSGHAIVMCKTDYAGTHCRIRISAALRVCDSTGAIRANGSTIGGGSPDIISSATLINRNVFGFNLSYPVTIIAGDFLMYEVGFSVSLLSGSQDVNGSTVWMDFGEALADVPNSSTNTVQGSPWLTVVSPVSLSPISSTSSPTRVLIPLSPVCPAKRVQSPSVPERNSDILNEFVLN